ncbi:hypothetical protein GYMLUDRAFT_39584 [Collybiopsis luxurians FD-317 M1]|nr:hypothetical protein GYMLUDRAFT_39584 [Collybiopsis luxurians FD-317 M1]
MVPDILCFLKLQGELVNETTYICLAIQCKFNYVESSLAPYTLREVIATDTPVNNEQRYQIISYHTMVRRDMKGTGI